MDSDQGKLFIGGISWETNEVKLRDYFQGYGEVLQTAVMRDKISGKPRGFGFVVFADPSILDTVLQDRHVIDGRTVEAKRAISRDENYVSKNGNSVGSQNYSSSGGIGTKKIFVGGLPATLTEDGFRQYFETYGAVTDVVIMYDQQTNRPRGFGFISFDSEDAVDRVLHKTFHDLNGKQVEVKRALPKDASPGGGGRAAGGGGYQNYGSSSGTYDGRLESSRYMHSQSTGGGFPAYNSSAYNMPGYGHGPAYNGMGYGYGNSNPGYSGAAGGSYNNPNALNPGYGGPAGGYGNPMPGYGGLQSAQRSSWGPLPIPAYGYGSSQWGATPGGGASNAGALTGQSPSGASGYANQGYGYGGYGGGDAAYGSRAGNGSIPGDAQGPGGGYMGDGYVDGNSGWRSDPPQPSAYYGSGGHSAGGRPGRQ